MTVLLVLATFAIFLTIDYFYAKAKHPVLQVAPAIRKPAGVSVAPRQPSMVGGFNVPGNLRYHPGHTWALSESPSLVRIGMDDFASKLAGKIEGISLPQRGQWIRQGQKVWSIVRNGKKLDMVSPIEGTVADINEAVVNDPALATKDPYGEGWLVTVQSSRRQDQLPQPAGRRAGPLVDGRILHAVTANDAGGSWSTGAGRRRGNRRRGRTAS